jgi:hypothetical protein
MEQWRARQRQADSQMIEVSGRDTLRHFGIVQNTPMSRGAMWTAPRCVALQHAFECRAGGAKVATRHGDSNNECVYGFSVLDGLRVRGISFRCLFPDFESYRHPSFGGMNCPTCAAGGWWYGHVLARALAELSAMSASRLHR